MPDTSDMSATRMRHEWDTSATRVLHERHKCDKSATRTSQMRHGWKILILIPTRVKTFLHLYIYYTASERLQGEEQFHSNNYFLEMPCFHAKMPLNSAPQKLEILMTEAISKSCTLDWSCKCPCTFPHSYAK